MREDDFELAIKIVIVGNGVVGKSSMIQRVCRGIFTNEYKKTLGVDFMERMIRVKSENIRLMLWDTAGQEEFDAITKAYYRGANACVIVFSVTDRDSFLSIEKWKRKVEYECGDIPMALVMNKMDLNHKSLVKREEVESIVKKYKFKLFKTSVKDNINVENVFQFLAESYVESVNDDYSTEEPVLSHLSIFADNVSNISPMTANNPSFATNPLFANQNQFSSKYRQQNYKFGFNYINNGFVSQSLGSNAIQSDYGYKNRFSAIPVRQQHSQPILLHRHHQRYQHYLRNHSLYPNYRYNANNFNSDSNNLFKNSFFKTHCKIF